MDLDHDLPDLELLDMDSDLGAHIPPPDEPTPPGRRPARDSDSWLAKSPWWCLPLIVTTLIGVERVLMVVTAPGAREWSIAIFGALFIITSGAFLTVGGLVIGHHRYK